ncbi:hypothetical protein L7F22_012742 [Adiantum nelumboides]|nr:hypothetical protein [Adiantum nelumboides]
MASSQSETLYNIKKLDGTNFPFWKKQIWQVLVQKKQVKPLKLKGERPEGMAEDEWEELDEFHSKTKHVDVKYHFIREVLEDKQIQLMKIHTKDNLSDLLTKGLPGEGFVHCHELLGIG